MKKSPIAKRTRTQIGNIDKNGTLLSDAHLRLALGAAPPGGGGSGGTGTEKKTYPPSLNNPGESDGATDTVTDQTIYF